MDPRHRPLTQWRKNSLSVNNGDCVEVARMPGGEVGVRDSKVTQEPFPRYTPEEFTAFLAGAKKGEFDEFHRSRFAAHE
jgi:hypothetical protein